MAVITAVAATYTVAKTVASEIAIPAGQVTLPPVAFPALPAVCDQM